VQGQRVVDPLRPLLIWRHSEGLDRDQKPPPTSSVQPWRLRSVSIPGSAPSLVTTLSVHDNSIQINCPDGDGASPWRMWAQPALPHLPVEAATLSRSSGR
jgi:hypothetical protein